MVVLCFLDEVEVVTGTEVLAYTNDDGATSDVAAQSPVHVVMVSCMVLKV